MSKIKIKYDEQDEVRSSAGAAAQLKSVLGILNRIPPQHRHHHHQCHHYRHHHHCHHYRHHHQFTIVIIIVIITIEDDLNADSSLSSVLELMVSAFREVR